MKTSVFGGSWQPVLLAFPGTKWHILQLADDWAVDQCSEVAVYYSLAAFSKLDNMEDSSHNHSEDFLLSDCPYIWRMPLGPEDGPYLKAVSNPGCLIDL